DLMCGAERDSLKDQIVRKLCRQQKPRRCRRRKGLPLYGKALDRLDEHRDGRLNGIQSVEYRRLIFLQITIIRQWETLQDCKQADQVAIHPARLAANEFGDVGVLLMRHHTTAG